MIQVTKTFLPPFEDYASLIKEAYDAGWITNNGQLVQRLESELKQYLGVKHLFLCSNGTISLQIAIKALELKGEIITTPFSYVATTNSIIWENCKPVFADIDPDSFCIDPFKIESLITADTSAILATHVYGIPCDIPAIAKIAEKHSIKVIYDAAHSFGSKLDGRSVLDYGDISSCSFHATKIFHTVEGGCLTTNDDEVARKIYLYRQFGHVYDDYFSVGINGKNSEFHAAMGLAILPRMADILTKRKSLTEQYLQRLSDSNLQTISYPRELEPNYAYFPVVFNSEKQLLKVKETLEAQEIFTRRYFFPALNTLPFVDFQPCPVAEDVARRVLCLPLFYELTEEQVSDISSTIIKEII